MITVHTVEAVSLFILMLCSISIEIQMPVYFIANISD